MSLAEYQEAFTQALLAPFPDGTEFSRIPDVQASPLASLQFRALRKQVLANLTQTLAKVYPTAAGLMGTTTFTTAARDYFLEYPPNAVDPVGMTAQFPAFIAQYRPALKIPHLADLATVDQGYYQAGRSESQSALSTQIFAELSPEQLAARKVKLHPSCYWFSSPYAVYDIWRAQRNTTAAAPENFFTPQDLLIIRPHLSVEIHKIDAGFVRTLDELDNGKSLGRALTLGNLVDKQFNTAAAMQFLIQNNLIVALY